MIDYKKLKDESEQLSAEVDWIVEEYPDMARETRELQEFLADRYKTLLFLSGD